MTTGKTIALTRGTLVGKVMSLHFNMLSRLVITFLPRSKHLLISWLRSPSAVILEPHKIKSDTVSQSISHLFLFLISKKIRDTKRIFHAKMGSTKERNGMDLTEQKILKRGGKNIQKNCKKKISRSR